MVEPGEAIGRCRVAKCFLESGLDIRFEGDIDDAATLFADQMVMVMAGDLLGQLEPGMIIGSDYSVHNPDFFKHNEVPVGRALGKFIAAC